MSVGILNPQRASARLALTRHAPSADLSPFVDRFWIVRWDLDEPHVQETLPFPCAHLVVGAHRPGLFGVVTERFVARLEGRGWVIGAKFRPAGLTAFLRMSMHDLTNRTLSIGDAFGEAGRDLDGDLQSIDSPIATDRERVARFEAFLRALGPVHEEEAIATSGHVELVQSERAITRVAALSDRVGVSIRALERAFRRWVGVSPKWVVRRARAQEAAARVAEGGTIDWPALAHELGYFDQAHFIRDFKSNIGLTPTEYAARCL